MPADVLIENHGSVALFTPMTPDAHKWVKEHVEIEPWQRIGASIACEPRCLEQLVEGMQQDGLVVDRSRDRTTNRRMTYQPYELETAKWQPKNRFETRSRTRSSRRWKRVAVYRLGGSPGSGPINGTTRQCRQQQALSWHQPSVVIPSSATPRFSFSLVRHIQAMAGHGRAESCGAQRCAAWEWGCGIIYYCPITKTDHGPDHRRRERREVSVAQDVLRLLASIRWKAIIWTT